MPSKEARQVRRDSAKESILTGMLSLSALQFPWIRKTRGAAVVRSVLASMFSLSALRFPWVRKTPRRGELKAAILTALVHIDHYEDRDTRRPVEPDAASARSVGLSYREIQRRVRAKYPGGNVSIMTIRSYARDAKLEGWTMPYRRPNSTRREAGSGGEAHDRLS